MVPSAIPLLTSLLALNVALAGLLVVVMFRVRTLAARVAAISGETEILERLRTVERATEGVVRQMDQIVQRIDLTKGQLPQCLQKVGLVRYDAFKEMGGQLSFSVALLDGKRDGVVFSILNDRGGARAYAKPVTGGTSSFTLSTEEQQAIAQSWQS
jgi:uncharacterized protein DUF4446